MISVRKVESLPPYLPPSPVSIEEKTSRHFQLVSFQTGEETDPMLPAFSAQKPLVWEELGEVEKMQQIAGHFAVWQGFSERQRCRLLSLHLGTSLLAYGATDTQLASRLKQEVGRDLFLQERFAEILYLHLSTKAGFAPHPETGVALLDPTMRATHYLTLSMCEQSDDVCFAFVLSHDPGQLQSAFFTFPPLEREPSL